MSMKARVCMPRRSASGSRLSTFRVGGAPVFIAGLGGTYAAAGCKPEALRIMQQLQELSKSHYVMSYWIVLLHTSPEERDVAFYWLERAYEERSATLALIKVDPRLDFLRSDSRFEDLVKRMNLT